MGPRLAAPRPTLRSALCQRELIFTFSPNGAEAHSEYPSRDTMGTRETAQAAAVMEFARAAAFVDGSIRRRSSHPPPAKNTPNGCSGSGGAKQQKEINLLQCAVA